MAEDEYTRQFHVTIEHVPWRGDSPVKTEDAITQFTQAVYVNGTLMTFRDWMDANSEGGAEIDIECGASLEMRGFMELRLRHLDDAAFDALDTSQDDWMDDENDTRENFAIPVASLGTRSVPVLHARMAGSF